MYCKCGCGQITPIAKRSRPYLGHIKGRHTDYIKGHSSSRISGYSDKVRDSQSSRALSDLTGMRFGALVVVSLSHQKQRYSHDGKPVGRRTYWLCVCDCGSESAKESHSLTSGKSASCGCLKAAKLSMAARRHGDAPRKGQSVEYRCWCHIKYRCENPDCESYEDYGGREIRVCARWSKSFEAFLQDMGRRPDGKTSIDRIDVDRDYEPSNCRWSTAHEQNLNQRRRRRKLDGKEGEIRALLAKGMSGNAIAHSLGVSTHTVHRKIKEMIIINRPKPNSQKPLPQTT